MGYFYYENFDVTFYSSFYLKMNFMDTQVPNKFKDLLLCVLKLFMISLNGVVFINRKDYIIDLRKRLKAFRSNFDKIFNKLMTMGHLLILTILSFLLKAF